MVIKQNPYIIEKPYFSVFNRSAPVIRPTGRLKKGILL
ncbi:hypothetical protein l13_09330 [Neisseria weaveri ATCC 51223]|nr:hypothetical protein l13_09330 [Neisseria weaveri ATCC 51223]